MWAFRPHRQGRRIPGPGEWGDAKFYATRCQGLFILRGFFFSGKPWRLSARVGTSEMPTPPKQLTRKACAVRIPRREPQRPAHARGNPGNRLASHGPCQRRGLFLQGPPPRRFRRGKRRCAIADTDGALSFAAVDTRIDSAMLDVCFKKGRVLGNGIRLKLSPHSASDTANVPSGNIDFS